MVQEVKSFGIHPIGPFSYEQRFPGSSAKPHEIPDQAQSTSKEAQERRPVAGFRAGALRRSSSRSTEGMCCRAVGISPLQEHLVPRLRGVLPEES